jgi:UDP-N-acetylmuramoyl-L-alanyl-D-glutamate--2,6-diaminopimelate ligase
METVPNEHGLTVVVDYAHAPDPLEKALEMLRTICSGKLVCVFGCGGDRDRGKRPIMGSIAERLADRVIVTSDNPRTEDPETIINEIFKGIQDRSKVRRIADRRQAIAAAIEELEPADILLIAGKGHEDYQIIGTTKLPFDDREVARENLASPRRVKS